MKRRLISLVGILVLVTMVLPSIPLVAAAPSVQSVTETAFSSSTTSHNVNMPATVEAGDLLIVLFANDDDDTVTTPDGWTQLASTDKDDDVRLSVYYKIAAGDEDGATVDFVTSDNEQAAAQVYRITNWHGTTPPEISTATTGNSGSPNPGSLNPTGWGSEETLWIAAVGMDRDQDLNSVPSNYTDGVETKGGSNGATTISARRVLTADSEDPGSFDTDSNDWVAFTIAIRPAATCTTYYRDDDNDTYGQTGDSQCLFAPSDPYDATVGGDCDDIDPAINPGADEICDGVDNNCDGQTDEGVMPTWYQDSDSDTYGDPDVSTQSCSQPGGYVADSGDCDDTDPAVNPGADEICDDQIDNDCDGYTDIDDDDCFCAAVQVQLAMILDGSGSIGSGSWTIMVNGLAAAVEDGQCVPQNGTVELTIVQFSGDISGGARVEVGPVVITASNAAAVATQIRAISQAGGYTPLACGIYLAADTLAASPCFDPSLKQAINVVTDGEPNRCCTASYSVSTCDTTNARASAVTARNSAISLLGMTTDQDEIDAEFIGTADGSSAWLRDAIVYPQPGYYAPPFTTGGWVRVVSDADDFAATICEKFAVIVCGPCEEYNPTNGQCEPKVCDPCYECNPNTGECESTCTECQYCEGDTCVDYCEGTVDSCGCDECISCDDCDPCTEDSCVAGVCYNTPIPGCGECPECTTLETPTIVSDTDTQVTAGNTGGPYPYDAVLAWVSPSWSGIDYAFPAGAEWIWETEYVVHPVLGDVVSFQRIVTIPDDATSILGIIHITCDNGYELTLNSTVVGSAQVHGAWRGSDLTETYVNSDGWQSVECWDITSLLGTGDNTFVIDCANEQMNDGTQTSNPGGLIFEISLSYCVPIDCPVCEKCENDQCVPDPGQDGDYCDDPGEWQDNPQNPCQEQREVWTCDDGQCVPSYEYRPANNGEICSYGAWEDDPANDCQERRLVHRCDDAASCNPTADEYEYRPANNGEICSYGAWEDDPANDCQERRLVHRCDAEGSCEPTADEYEYQPAHVGEICSYGAWEDDPANACQERRLVNICDEGGNCVPAEYEYRNKPDYTECGEEYYTEWEYYCEGNSVWRTRDFHDFYCLDGECYEDIITENELYADCDDGNPCTRDWCEDGTCHHQYICGTGGGFPDTACYLWVDMLGEIYRVEMKCCPNESIEYHKCLDPDELHFIEIEEDMEIICGDCAGCTADPKDCTDCHECRAFPKVIVMSLAEESPTPPDGTVVVGSVYYDFTGFKDTLRFVECDIATFFYPEISILLGFDPETIPPGGFEPFIAWYDAELGVWNPLPSDPDRLAGADFVTGLTNTFASTFAVLVNVPPPEEAPPPPPPATPEPAHFVVGNLNVTPAESKVEETVTISVNVANDGEQEGTYLVELMIDGQKVDEEEVTLGAGQSEEVTFAVAAAEPGQYEVVVSGLSGGFTVLGAINWWLWGSIIAAVILFAAWLVWYRQRRMGAEPAP